jgi:hypothetical protein
VRFLSLHGPLPMSSVEGAFLRYFRAIWPQTA